MIFECGRALIRFALKQFFGAITVEGVPLCEEGPVLVVANHPNDMIDPFLVAAAFRRPLWFLAKSTLFVNKPVSAFLRACHLVPVYRRQDSSDLSKNAETFRLAAATLREGRGIVVFPEGTSAGERFLLPLKTGSARIAFQAEEESGFSLGLKLQPIGITYADLHGFKSTVTITGGAPIAVSSYRERYLADPIGTAKALTEEIEQHLKSLTVDIRDGTQARLAERVGWVYQSKNGRSDDRARLEEIAKRINELEPKYQPVRGAIEAEIDEFLELSRFYRFDGARPLAVPPPVYFIAAPLVILGAVINFIPYRLVAAVVKRWEHDPVLLAGRKFSLGLLFFTAWYAALSLAAGVLTGSAAGALAVFAALVAFGILTNAMLHPVRILLRGRKRGLAELITMRDALIEKLEAIRHGRDLK